jgi:hypothetical protein
MGSHIAHSMQASTSMAISQPRLVNLSTRNIDAPGTVGFFTWPWLCLSIF